MKAPENLHELTSALSQIMAGAINGTLEREDGKIALNAATRIVEVIQAETRVRALAFATKTHIPSAIPLNQPIWPKPETPPTIEAQ